MDGVQFIAALAASSGTQARDNRWLGILEGIELMLDRLAEEGVPSDEWVNEVRNFIAVAKEHQP